MADADIHSLERELAAMHAASWGWALACCRRDRDQAEDALQQAYVKALSGRARHDGRSSLKTWFFGVVRLTALEQRRFAAIGLLRRKDAPETEELQAASSPDPAVARETAEAVAACLSKLPERQREVLHLVFYEGLTIAEAALIMDVSLGTARQHYERGKANMLAALERRGVGA